MNVLTRQNSFCPSSVALESANAPEDGPATPSGANLGTQSRRKPSAKNGGREETCQPRRSVNALRRRKRTDHLQPTRVHPLQKVEA